MKEVVFLVAFLAAHLVISQGDPGWRNYQYYFRSGKVPTPYSPYGSFWRGGRALNQFPFSQQANLPRPTPKPDLNRRDAQEQGTSEPFGFQFMNRRFGSELPSVQPVSRSQPSQDFQTTGSGLEQALARHAQELKDHEARVQAQLSLMGISDQNSQAFEPINPAQVRSLRPRVQDHRFVSQSSRPSNVQDQRFVHQSPKQSNIQAQRFVNQRRPVQDHKPRVVVQEATVVNQPVKPVPGVYQDKLNTFSALPHPEEALVQNRFQEVAQVPAGYGAPKAPIQEFSEPLRPPYKEKVVQSQPKVQPYQDLQQHHDLLKRRQEISKPQHYPKEAVQVDRIYSESPPRKVVYDHPVQHNPGLVQHSTRQEYQEPPRHVQEHHSLKSHQSSYPGPVQDQSHQAHLPSRHVIQEPPHNRHQSHPRVSQEHHSLQEYPESVQESHHDLISNSHSNHNQYSQIDPHQSFQKSQGHLSLNQNVDAYSEKAQSPHFDPYSHKNEQFGQKYDSLQRNVHPYQGPHQDQPVEHYGDHEPRSNPPYQPTKYETKIPYKASNEHSYSDQRQHHQPDVPYEHEQAQVVESNEQGHLHNEAVHVQLHENDQKYSGSLHSSNQLYKNVQKYPGPIHEPGHISEELDHGPFLKKVHQSHISHSPSKDHHDHEPVIHNVHKYPSPIHEPKSPQSPSKSDLDHEVYEFHQPHPPSQDHILHKNVHKYPGPAHEPIHQSSSSSPYEHKVIHEAPYSQPPPSDHHDHISFHDNVHKYPGPAHELIHQSSSPPPHENKIIHETPYPQPPPSDYHDHVSLHKNVHKYPGPAHEPIHQSSSSSPYEHKEIHESVHDTHHLQHPPSDHHDHVSLHKNVHKYPGPVHKPKHEIIHNDHGPLHKNVHKYPGPFPDSFDFHDNHDHNPTIIEENVPSHHNAHGPLHDNVHQYPDPPHDLKAQDPPYLTDSHLDQHIVLDENVLEYPADDHHHQEEPNDVYQEPHSHNSVINSRITNHNLHELQNSQIDHHEPKSLSYQEPDSPKFPNFLGNPPHEPLNPHHSTHGPIQHDSLHDPHHNIQSPVHESHSPNGPVHGPHDPHHNPTNPTDPIHDSSYFGGSIHSSQALHHGHDPIPIPGGPTHRPHPESHDAHNGPHLPAIGGPIHGPENHLEPDPISHDDPHHDTHSPNPHNPNQHNGPFDDLHHDPHNPNLHHEAQPHHPVQHQDPHPKPLHHQLPGHDPHIDTFQNPNHPVPEVFNPKARQPIKESAPIFTPIEEPPPVFNPRARQPPRDDFVHFHPDEAPYGSGEILEPVVPVQHLDPHDDYQVNLGPPDLNIGVIAQPEQTCVDKIEYVEETVIDEEIECHHTYEQKCQTSYTTDFESVQEEECDESFQKDCFIEYKKVAMNETVRMCHTPLVKDCNLPGPVDCKTEYETMCETRYHEHNVVDDIPDCREVKEYKCQQVSKGYSSEEECKEWPVQKCLVKSELVTKVTPETKCHKVPKELCAPYGCGFIPGPEECIEKKETVIEEVPEESCDLTPRKHCKHVTRLVPNLKPVEDCTDVPKEICAKQKSAPRKVKKPVTKKWCYTPEPY